MPLRRRDGGDDRRTFELVESAGIDVDPDLLDAPHPVLLGALPRDTPPGLGAHDATVAAGDGPDGVDVEGPPPHPREPRGDRRRARWVAAAVVTGVVVVLVGGMLVVDTVTSRDAQERLEVARGAVRPLDAAPTERWTASAATDRGVGFLPGLLVTVEGDEAVALDLDSGAEAWRAPLGGDEAVCGSWSPWELPGVASREVVCVAGSGVGPFWYDPGTRSQPEPGADVPPAHVTVLGAAGQVVGERDVEVGGAVLVPGPDGGLVRAERVGEPGEPSGPPVAVDPGAGESVDGVAGRDVVVTVEDALTGDVRWRSELPFQDVPWSCTTWDPETGGEEIDPDRLTLVATETLVDVGGCGVAASFLPDGERLDDPDLPTDGAVPLAGGRFLVDADRQGTTGALRPDRVLDGAGVPVLDAPGEVLDPQATDDPAPGVLLVRDGIDLRAYDDEGARLWTYDGARVPEAVYVLAEGTAVVGTASTVLALDALSGEQTWSRFLDDLGGDEGRSAMVTQAFTDGRCAILVLVDPSTGTHPRVVALELSSGSVVWEQDLEGEWASFVPAQGRLLRWDGRTVALLG
ncbi:outer membrane protein assembly factor BamB family protein [Cellulosimicrobium cellulans]|uniref:outer membrane protein assembly factor BamB family protein n=1 Tax=Cellulosimicrobium cellulans TaxID=1710 RepID=UPI0020980D01|nr:PQQ-binding-like beta-propeller repeat protein [Cellulosimicrobium cellulans]MCO7274926.1 PQQ-like beta-propeller repeat protein [Cellulosimicrobium cellulans]